jgi:DNA polymerase elongation subunit (family B)
VVSHCFSPSCRLKKLFFFAIIALEADEKIEILKHYFGITYEDELVVRGIETRRHDTPNVIKQFQTQLLYTLFDCKDSSEVVKNGYEDDLLLLTQAIDEILQVKIFSSKTYHSLK